VSDLCSVQEINKPSSEEYKKGSLDIRENSSPKTLSILFCFEQEKRIKKDKKYLVFNK
jgi:hypothetical protein